MTDSDVLERMRREWNERAREDPHYYVAFGRRDQDDAEFFATAADVVRGLRTEAKHLRPAGKPFPQNLKALEIGCGPGRIMRSLSANFAEIHGTDVSDAMLHLAADKLRGISNAFLHHTEKSDLSLFPDESFDFIYSYAVFQHIPSREIVFRYLTESHRLLKPGGILRCQINGLPQTASVYTTWAGARVSSEEVAEFAWRHDFQLYALEHPGTQYLWTTCRKRPAGWRDSICAVAAPGTRIRIISNALTADPLVPAAGPRAFAALRMESLPADGDLLNLEVRIDGRVGAISYLGPPEWDGVVQLNAAIPPGTRTGLVPVEALWLGAPLTKAWMRIVPPGPVVPRLLAVQDGENLLSGSRIISRSVKLVMEETLRPDLFHGTIDGVDINGVFTFCVDPVDQRHEINFPLPASIGAGSHELRIQIGSRAFAPVTIEVA
jgi:2-polyprenyl-3-methyl-5-hydroxy-6-metoxy-1,4-benzoquinol methylase